MNANHLLIGLLILVAFSCRKDPKIEELINTDPQPLERVTTPGSWWKYNWYDIDSIGVATLREEKDCVYVVGDTIINGNVYTHQKGTSFGRDFESYKRDSLHYIIDRLGYIIYSSARKIDTLHMSSGAGFTSYRILNGIPSNLNMPAGNFEVIKRELHYTNTDLSPFTPCDSIFVFYSAFSNGVGIVSSITASFGIIQYNCTYMESRLIDYYIAP